MEHFFDYYSANNLLGIFSYEIYGNSVLRILITLCIFLALFFGVKYGISKLNKISDKLGEDNRFGFFIKILNQIPNWLYLLVEIFIPINFLKWSVEAQIFIRAFSLLAITIFLIKLGIKCVNFSLEKVFKRDKTAKKSVSTIVTILVRALGIFGYLMNIGINITPILTGFGIAGIAVAFALQSILTDLFSSFSILLSKPFIVGDLIKVGEGSSEKQGTVKQISLKSTTLTTVQGQEVIIPNSSILSTEIINYRTMKHRRQRISIGVTYDTGHKKLKKIPSLVEDIIKTQKDVVYERCHLESMGDFSINFLISYDITNPDYVKSLEINEQIYLGMVENFEKEGIEFAFPSQTLYLKK